MLYLKKTLFGKLPRSGKLSIAEAMTSVIESMCLRHI